MLVQFDGEKFPTPYCQPTKTGENFWVPQCSDAPFLECVLNATYNYIPLQNKFFINSFHFDFFFILNLFLLFFVLGILVAMLWILPLTQLTHQVKLEILLKFVDLVRPLKLNAFRLPTAPILLKNKA